MLGSYRPIILSVPTSAGGATAAATYMFLTAGYKPARQLRAIGSDTVVNQNGIFNHVYDNGPGPHTWDIFEIVCSDEFWQALGSATVQRSRFEHAWNHRGGGFGLDVPDGVYTVHWGAQPAERRFRSYPSGAGDKLEYRIPVQFEEG